MVIFLNTDGDAQIITPEAVYQGSDNVTDITVIAPFSAQTTMSIGFILPNGLYWLVDGTTAGGNYAPMVFVEQDFTTKANVWKYTLPRSVTEIPGVVRIAINAAVVIDADGATEVSKSNCTSFLCDFTVQESVVPIPPATEPPADVYELLRQYLAYLDARTANVPNLVADINQTASNAFTYTDNKGIVSAPIVFGDKVYDPTYVGAASVINVPVDAWQQPVGGGSYTAVITAAQHGQMQEGVSADDLWVSFVSANGTGFDGVYQGYTVDAAGNITITATTPVALTVRVWNGKGLTDEISREQIKQLQEDVAELQNSDVDTTARADIAAEVQRATAAEASLQSAINENTGKIERIDNVIPSTATTENQLADKAFVNSSINNMAAFYITHNAQGDAFPDHASLVAATTFYSGGKARVPTQNDYAIVLSDESQTQNADGTYPTTRYSWQGGTYPTGQWGFQYIVNNTPLTQAQVDAINSGITFTKIANIDAAIAGKYTKPTTGIPESDLDESLQDKINNNNSSGVNAAKPTVLGTVYGLTLVDSNNAVTALGYNVYIKGINCTAIGHNSTANERSIVLGHNSYANSDAIALGYSSYAHNYGVALGYVTRASSNYATAIGSRAGAIGWSTAVGGQANATTTYTTALGYNTNARNTYATAVGISAQTNGERATAIGSFAKANGFGSTAIGTEANANANYSIVLGGSQITSLRCNVQTITALSDERTKEYVQLANTAQCLADVNKLPVKRFKFKKGIHPTEIDVHRTGFIAQDVEKVFPKEVETDPSSFWAVDANNEYIYEDETDDDGNVVYEDELDANGERIVENETTDANGEKVIIYKRVVKRKHKEYTIEDCKKINMHDALPTLWAAVQELSKQLAETKAELAKVKSFVKYVATESEVTG